MPSTIFVSKNQIESFQIEGKVKLKVGGLNRQKCESNRGVGDRKSESFSERARFLLFVSLNGYWGISYEIISVVTKSVKIFMYFSLSTIAS